MSARLVRRDDRSVIEVRGNDRVRWLDGMVSNDVEALDAEGPASGCYALLLTPQGRIVADLHVWARPDRLLLELEGSAVADVIARLERYVIADDVELVDAAAAWARLGLEGAGAGDVVAHALGEELPLADEAVGEVALAGARVLVAAYGLAGSGGRQLAVDPQAADPVWETLVAAGAQPTALADLEAMRVEHGIPTLGRELDEEVLPAEARLERAISETKGCYTGQEVVARMRSRGRVAHLLVGLRFADGPPAAGTRLVHEGREVGEVTSAVRSERWAAIGLGYVRRAQSEPGTTLAAGEVAARVVALPFGAEGEA